MKRLLVFDEDEAAQYDSDMAELNELRNKTVKQADYSVFMNPQMDGVLELLGVECKNHHYSMLPLESESRLYYVCKDCTPSLWKIAFEKLTQPKSEEPSKTRTDEPESLTVRINGADISIPTRCEVHGTWQTGVMRAGQFSYVCLLCESKSE